jgi:endonuclease/exonuclease/phosphatase family metal-dependent hydrolase
MRVATWNLQCARPGYGARSQRLQAALAAVAPDVWVLTESHPDFVPAPGYVRRAVSAEAPDRSGGGRWVVIWARTEIAAEPLAVAREPERAAAVRIRRPGGRELVVFGTVLPWRGDTRHSDVRGGQAFARSLGLQAADWDTVPGAELCVAGDFNQEFGANGPVGTRAGRAALEAALAARDLACVTGGVHDPLLARGWRANIDHVVVSRGLRTRSVAEVWPEHFPLPRGLSDHHGVCVSLADA